MRYAALLCEGDKIGICTPSSGIFGELETRLNKAESNLLMLGYGVEEADSVRFNEKCVSAPSKTRAEEFMKLYQNPDIAAIIPPWGGEFLMDMLSYLDVKKLSSLPPKWICGYSDISTLAFFLTVSCDISTVHGSNLMNMGHERIHKSDLTAFSIMSNENTIQNSSEYYGICRMDTSAEEAYILDKKTEWKALRSETELHFEGRMIGGCMDTLCKLIGTDFAQVNNFLEKYKKDGFIWCLESCEMSAGDIYRTLWQMRECGWFSFCNGILYGRADGYKDTSDFNLSDALENGLGCLNIPVIYETDIGHIPPQIQILNGSYGSVDFRLGKGSIRQIQTV